MKKKKRSSRKRVWVVVSLCLVAHLQQQDENVGILVFKSKKKAKKYVDYIHCLCGEQSYIIPAGYCK